MNVKSSYLVGLTIYQLAIHHLYIHTVHTLPTTYSSSFQLLSAIAVTEKLIHILMETQLKEVEVVNRSLNFSGKDLAVRLFALTLTLVAAVLLGVNKETKTVSVTLVSSLPPIDLPVTAKWTQMSAFVYFVIANAIACTYGATSLLIILVTRGRNKVVSLMITILDLVMVGVLFSAVGATGSVGLIGYKGNSHVNWDKVCNVFDKFCHQISMALFMSFAGGIAYFVLIVLSTLKLHNKF
ncbi:hypothetical protein QVD17_01762 [Tagetes erecta]|uniref:CASP-like protein n=1 Tax=Tagetes erecta TaxID=13708 RepID=A0AAD8L7W7_TARER|nr:hypothetical protein QVD17_01762 [Tagetes erecta]